MGRAPAPAGPAVPGYPSTQPLHKGSGQGRQRPQHRGPSADPCPRGGCCPQLMLEHPRPLHSAPRCTLQDWGHSEVGQSPRCPLLPMAAPAPGQAPTVPCSTLRDGIVRAHRMGRVPGAVPFRHRGQALQVLGGLQRHAIFWQTLLSQ